MLRIFMHPKLAPQHADPLDLRLAAEIVVFALLMCYVRHLAVCAQRGRGRRGTPLSRPAGRVSGCAIEIVLRRWLQILR